MASGPADTVEPRTQSISADGHPREKRSPVEALGHSKWIKLSFLPEMFPELLR